MSIDYNTVSDLYRLLTRWVSPGTLPAEFETEFYRHLHEDLASMNDEALIAHYETIGRGEGRLASPAAHRSGLVATIAKGKATLEIGPFTKPILISSDVKYFDVMAAPDLLERAQRIGFPVFGNPEIDYVSPNGDLSIVADNSFDLLISSHNIEHQPDIIGHLEHVSRILRPRGLYMLIIPDKRFCFDHFLEESELEEIIRAHEEHRIVHTPKSVYEHMALTTHSNPVAHWLGHHADPNFERRAQRAHEAVVAYHKSRGAYIDVHAWQFTPTSFRSLIDSLNQKAMIQLSATRVYDTPWGTYEFCAVLEKVENRLSMVSAEPTIY